MNQPLVSVLMTAYNREKYIAQAIESVMASTYRNWELIITDDRSSDNTVAIAKEYAVKDKRITVYVNENNLGDYHNRNKAASYATGEYLKYLDSDDLIYKYGLEAFVDFMEQDKDVALGISAKRNFTKQPFPIIMSPSESLRYNFFTEGFLDCAPTGTIIRRTCFEEVGRFSGKRMIGDFEFGLKTAARFKVMLLPPALFFWREHGEQEISIGLKNNMYPQQYQDVLNDQFPSIGDDLLTDAEKKQIWQFTRRLHRMNSIKSAIKKILR